ncbi:hypothetical protein DICPUDRAFT_74949 [Dictyostelium purpureum]|uniref:FNIP repeat-containing protein n=1 Tax=Dictyostelium purpureum TaxID=5786 RepID=F0Z977_DICPU|nr:uncharacterized protein DICPUDRAFT_74949 [Dictyostelium purpureum]EGC39505.1 hypothetical protein DICPUDRAFT_74949 [Dictyostelium purpureum]|eukprot:XP_003283952.1 hypothetical protein DICPUDRAFT_74949 [Dictyostelium purpureum]
MIDNSSSNNEIKNHTIKNNNNNLIRDISSLFRLVFNNIFLKSIIFKIIRDINNYIIKKCFKYKSFQSVYSLDHFKYKNKIKRANIFYTHNYLKEYFEYLPKNITSLKIEGSFFQKSPEKLPFWIKSLEIPNTTTPISSIVSNIASLETLIITRGNYLNNIIELKCGDLPSSLKKLVVNFGSLVLSKGVLPYGLEKLSVYDIDKIEKGSIPETLKELYLDESIFRSLKDYSYLALPGYLPNGIHTMDIVIKNQTFIIYPDSLKYLKIKCKQFTDEINFNLPSQLESLSIDVNSTKDLMKFTNDVFPNGLKLLHLSCCSNITNNRVGDKEVTSIFPDTIESLTISNVMFNEKLTCRSLPPNIKHLQLGQYSIFNNSGSPLIDPTIFPQSLTFIDLGSSFNQVIGPNVLPLGLLILKLGKFFNKIITKESIPSSLKLLEITNLDYYHTIPVQNPYTLVDCRYYHSQFMSFPENLVSFKSSNTDGDLIYPGLLMKAKFLEFLDLNCNINYSLLTLKLIKKIVLRSHHEINLENFQCLETIIVWETAEPLITTSKQLIVINNNIKEVHNFYNLHSIKIDPRNHSFVESLSPVFYRFLNFYNDSDLYAH